MGLLRTQIFPDGYTSNSSIRPDILEGTLDDKLEWGYVSEEEMVDFHSLSDEEINDLLEAEVKAAINDILYDPSVCGPHPTIQCTDMMTNRIDILSEQDRDNIRVFKLCMMSNMPRAAFNQMWQAFQHKITLDSEWVVMCRITILTGIQPEWHDCCINSCITYTSKYIYHISCPYCGEAR